MLLNGPNVPEHRCGSAMPGVCGGNGCYRQESGAGEDGASPMSRRSRAAQVNAGPQDNHLFPSGRRLSAEHTTFR